MANLGYFLLVRAATGLFWWSCAQCTAFRKCRSCVKDLDKERALVCLGCKDGLIAENTAVIEVGLPSAPKLGHPAPCPPPSSYLPFRSHIWPPDLQALHCLALNQNFFLNNLLQRWFFHRDQRWGWSGPGAPQGSRLLFCKSASRSRVERPARSPNNAHLIRERRSQLLNQILRSSVFSKKRFRFKIQGNLV